MTIEGSWTGSFAQTWPFDSSARPVRLEIRQSTFGSIRGTAHFVGEAGQDLSTSLRGRCIFRRLSFGTDIHPLPPARPPAGVKPASTAASSAVSQRATEWPSVFQASVRDDFELSGTWRSMTTWMVGQRRRKVPVILAEGTWTVRRRAA